MVARCACGGSVDTARRHVGTPNLKRRSTMSTLAVPAIQHTPIARPDRLLGLEPLGSYYDEKDEQREILALTLTDKSRLVIDSPSGGLRGALLIGRLAADEPQENARILSDLYLADEEKGHCRALRHQDLSPEKTSRPTTQVDWHDSLHDAEGREYRLALCDTGMSVPELHWIRTEPEAGEDHELLTLRAVVEGLDAYEPARRMTVQALSETKGREVSNNRTRLSLERLAESSTVLNRRLRQAVLASVAHGTSLSEIAARCGHHKTDSSGHVSGETTWIARRTGMKAEPGEAKPSRWVHVDVLALIARDGLDLAPMDVEL
jgi:hypothetical protein